MKLSNGKAQTGGKTNMQNNETVDEPVSATDRRSYRGVQIIEVTLCNDKLFVSVDGITVIDATAKTIKMTAHHDA